MDSVAPSVSLSDWLAPVAGGGENAAMMTAVPDRTLVKILEKAAHQEGGDTLVNESACSEALLHNKAAADPVAFSLGMSRMSSAISTAFGGNGARY